MATPRSGILKTPARKAAEKSKLKDPVEVFCRVRPLPESSEESCVEILGTNEIQLNSPKTVKTVSNKVDSVKCTFTKVFDEYQSQRMVFAETGLPLVDDLLRGKNGLCFMYGITGSGKTHTMNGTSTDCGVLPRCLDVVFNSVGSLQTERGVIKPDGYNGFEVLSEEQARTEVIQKQQEYEARTKSGKGKPDYDFGDINRIPDTTCFTVDDDNNYCVFISFVEIYNNSIFDLLDETPVDPICPKPPPSKILREDKHRNMFVYEATEVEVKTTEEAYEMFWKGQNKRRTAHTMLNTESSRSHCVFSIKIVHAPLGPNGDQILKDPNLLCVSQLSLCDLAGSERLSRTKAGGDRIREAGNINNSLMTLRSCIDCLRDNQKLIENGGQIKMVPYRDSKMTHLFKNFFDGDGKVRMVVCLNPKAEDYDESLHVMKFAEATQEVKVTQSTGVKFDLGLTPGRGKASRLFKQTYKDMGDELSSDMGSQEDLLAPLQQFASWPLLELSTPDDDRTLSNLMNYLEERIKLRQTLFGDWNRKQEEVRALIVQLEQDNENFTKVLDDQKTCLGEKEKELQASEKKRRSLNEKVESLTRSTHTFDMQRKQLEAEIEKQREIIHKERQEKMRLKQALKDLTSNERLRWEKECEKRVREMQIEMEGAVLEKSEKLRQLKNVVEGLHFPSSGGTSNSGGSYNMVTTTTSTTHHTPSTLKVDIHLHDEKPTDGTSAPAPVRKKVVSKTPGPASKPPTRTRTKTVTGATPRFHAKTRSKSPPPVSNKPTPIRSKHRRSRSSDYWLEHKPQTTLETDTVMQPKLGSKKTVSIPKVKDLKSLKHAFSSATPNYILTHQEEDSGGEIETKLIKGEILRTRGGGTSVQFTDIETLKKRLEEKQTPKSTPKSTKESTSKGKKRRSEEEARSDDSWTSVETRCAVAIEGKPGATPALTHHAKKFKPVPL